MDFGNRDEYRLDGILDCDWRYVDLLWAGGDPCLIYFHEEVDPPCGEADSGGESYNTDKQPADCTFAQLEVVPPHELASIFATSR